MKKKAKFVIFGLEKANLATLTTREEDRREMGVFRFALNGHA